MASWYCNFSVCQLRCYICMVRARTKGWLRSRSKLSSSGWALVTSRGWLEYKLQVFPEKIVTEKERERERESRKVRDKHKIRGFSVVKLNLPQREGDVHPLSFWKLGQPVMTTVNRLGIWSGWWISIYWNGTFWKAPSTTSWKLVMPCIFLFKLQVWFQLQLQHTALPELNAWGICLPSEVKMQS